MSLTFATGPFGQGGGQGSFDVPAHVWYLEDWPRRMRAVLAGETVLDSRRTKVLHETGRLPVHYFPLDDIRPDVLVDTTEESTYDRTGSMRHLDLRVGDRVAAGAVTAHLDPPAGAPPLAGYATVEFSAVDRWFEEDDPIYSHPRAVAQRSMSARCSSGDRNRSSSRPALVETLM